MWFSIDGRFIVCLLIVVGFLGACDFRQITEERPVKLSGSSEAPADSDDQQPVAQPSSSTRSRQGLESQ